MGQKDLKMGLKRLGLVWFGLVWLGCEPNWSELTPKILTASHSDFQSTSQTPKNKTFNFAILDNLKRVFGFSHDLGSLTGQAKPYHTKVRHFRPISRPFLPFFGQKTPKYHRERFNGA